MSGQVGCDILRAPQSWQSNVKQLEEDGTGRLNINWPVDEKWTAHRRRDILESLERLLAIRSVALLAIATRHYSKFETTADAEEAEAKVKGLTSKKKQRSLQRLAVQGAMGRALENATVDQLVRVHLTEDKQQVSINLTFPVPPQAMKVYITGLRAISSDPKNRTLGWNIADKVLDSVFDLISGKEGQSSFEMGREVRQRVDDEAGMILSRDWSRLMAGHLTLDLAFWARGEGIPGTGHICLENHKPGTKREGKQPEINGIYQIIDEAMSEVDTDLARLFAKDVKDKSQLMDRVIRSFGREPQPMWVKFTPVQKAEAEAPKPSAGRHRM